MDAQVGRAVPALEHRVDREAVVLADGDEPALVDERVDLGLVEVAASASTRTAWQDRKRWVA